MRRATILRVLPMLATTLLGDAAMAQAQAPATPPAQPQAQAPAPAPANSNTFIAERRQDQWLSSNLRGKNVYDRNDAKIGVINDLVIGHDGKVAAVVIGVGGFLGIGEKNVGVPFQDIKISMRENDEWLVLDRSKDDLRAAPAFGTATAPNQEVGAGDNRNYGTLNAPHRDDEAPPR